MRRKKRKATPILDVLLDPDSSLFDSAWKGLTDPVDVAALQRVVELSKHLDKFRADVKGLVTKLTKFTSASEDEVIEHLSAIARTVKISPGFYNRLVYEMDNHPTLKDPRGVLYDVVRPKNKEVLRTQIFDAKKAVQASTRRRLTK